jgi:hypothetical protein
MERRNRRSRRRDHQSHLAALDARIFGLSHTARGAAQPRKGWRSVLVATAVFAFVLSVAIPAFSTGSVGTAAGFEDDDANLAVASTFDWNGFNPTTWTGIAPNRQSTQTPSIANQGWQFLGLEDAQNVTTDSAFAGGTKQDNECASVITQKANNKEDLKRIYLASKTVSGHTYLMLAWVRIPQNSTSNSANVAFEFNRGTTACPAGSNGLVHRSTDDLTITGDQSDMLVVYDFTGGAGSPILKLERWIASGTCEVSSDSPPCWGVATTLPVGTAEAAVDTGLSGLPASAADTIGPAGGTETLGTVEFGEAGIDLTNAGVFVAGTCETFGKAYGVSRTSGNSQTAQMKDLVGPGNFNLTNCGSLKIVKQDSGGNNLAGAKFKVYKDDGNGVFEPGTGDAQVGSECTTTSDGTGDCTFPNLAIGSSFWVFETQAPTGYTTTTNPQLVPISGVSQTTVTFFNQPAVGDLKVVKKDDANNLMDNVKFTLTGTSTAGISVNLSCTTGVSNSDGSVPASGQCSFLSVPIGNSYTLDEDETTLPSGYSKDSTLPKTVAITSGGLTTVSVTNPRTHRIIVIVCHEGTNTLYSSNVDLGTTTKPSIGSPPSGITEAQLCGLGGATFGGLPHGDQSLTVDIASH